ncbi:hypothetical protein GWA97_12715 [Flavobacterium sp. LaA7.5]|nr:hypothetical protein [Flavobacterium salilacus subsp. altitudinum]
MYRIVLLFVAAFMLSGCGIEYDGSTKVIFEGRITDDAGNALEGISVQTEYYDGNDSDIAGIGKSDSDGNFRIIFPGADENVDIELMINHSGHYSESNNNIYSQTSYVNITPGVVKYYDYKINFSTIKLYPVSNNTVQLNLTIANELPPYRSIRKVNVIGLVNESYTDFDFNNIPTDTSMQNNGQYDYNNFNHIYSVAKNQVLLVKYMLSDYSVYEVEVPVGDENLEYTITY